MPQPSATETTASAVSAAEYERAKAMAASPDAGVRAGLAGRADTRPELLYYLADDDDPRVRRAVAGNDRTPIQATPRLARDRDGDVRALLAAKLARALPGLRPVEQAALRDIACHALELLAADQALRVRAALASALKDVDCAPPALVARLARDTAREVAEPILRTCATLTDDDLLAILSSRPEPWVAAAIAGRARVGPGVSDAVLADGDGSTGEVPADNPGTRLSPPALLPAPVPGRETVAGGTAVVEAAARPAVRPVLPPRLADRLSGLVEDEIRDALAGHAALDPESQVEIAGVVRRRLEWARGYADGEPPERKAMRLFAEGRLDEETVWDALAWGDRAFARAAVAVLARVPAEVVQRILDTQSAKAVTALAWLAGLSMRGARQLQARGARIPPRSLLNARHGTDYPLEPAEMQDLLELFGIPPRVRANRAG